jgi:predicted helicase
VAVKGFGAIDKYLGAIEHELRSGQATEHTHRPAMKVLIERLAEVQAINEPKRSACGAPDFSVSRPTGHGLLTLGYVEAKDVGIALDAVEESTQLDRYRAALSNLILTDYLEFRWYVNGEWRRTARLASLDAGGAIQSSASGEKEVLDLLGDFLAQNPPKLTKPRELAERMARLTRLIRDIVVTSFERDEATEFLRDLRNAFEEVLIPQLSVPDFADMFGQTIAYGLFAARANHDSSKPFTRRDAAYEIPRTNPFLRKLFAAITGPDLEDEPYAGLAEDLAQLLAVTDMKAVLSEFGRESRSDPVVHFYETFLAAYDPAVREMRGVYYTPEPVVSYIVSSADHALRERFGCQDGLSTITSPAPADRTPGWTEQPPRVLILDPACGSGTFLYSIIARIREQFRERGDAGKWAGFVREQLIPRLFGFELLVAPYAVAHLKLGMQLAAQDLPDNERRDWTYDLASGERLSVYLTNTLEEALKKSEILLGSYIAEEANAAASIKRELPILVVLGNPPYSGHSANRGRWIRSLIADYAKDRPGIPKPAQGKWLQDDYIKFIRFGQWRIEQTGAGVLAFITNHSYVDSPTFAGMRHSLLETFSDIYVLDLHGNTRKRERAPDGGVDQNVFDIEQGVAISLFIREPGKGGPARVHHADLYGERLAKYDWLSAHSAETTEWADVEPSEPLYLFAPQDATRREEYERGWPIPRIMDRNGQPAPGIVTTHDQFAISQTQAEARAKVERFLATRNEDEARSIWRLCSQDQWDYERAMKRLGSGGWESAVREVLYRPFDIRWTVYEPNVAVHRRERMTSHLQAGPNLGLITSRQTKGETFAHVQVTRLPAEAICMSSKTSNNGFVFPLYLYAQAGGPQRRLLIEGESTGRAPNLNPDFVAELESLLALKFVADGTGDLEATFGPEDVFHYVYAVLHAPAYRERYVDFLRYEPPRIALPTDRGYFAGLAERGAELVRLHLFDGPAPPVATNYPVPGSNVIAKGHPRYVAPGEPEQEGTDTIEVGRVYISQDNRRSGARGQYFRGIDPDVWAFHVGGYQVCEKWLKDRRGQTLTLADIEHYQRIVATIAKTIEIMVAVDALVLPALADMEYVATTALDD